MRFPSRLVAGLLCLVPMLLAQAAFGAASNYPLEKVRTDHSNLPSLQRGAALFMNYCLGCHSLEHQRHNRTAQDLGIPEDLYRELLLFDDVDIGSHITNAMPHQGAREWFGNAPPDLTMVTRVRGSAWVYTFLKSFYLDESRPFGVNNALFENVGMPHALIELQGTPRLSCSDGVCEETVVEAGSGRMTEAQYAEAVYDLVNFLDYTGEPYKQDRQRIGVYVLLFLLILFVFTFLLGREYHKEVH